MLIFHFFLSSRLGNTYISHWVWLPEKKVNCLTDVNRFSELFYILLEVYRIDLKIVIELSAEKIIQGQKNIHHFSFHHLL